MTVSNALKKFTFSWFAEGSHTRHDRAEFRKKHHIGTQRMKSLEIEYEIMIKEKTKRTHNVKKAQASLYKVLNPEPEEEDAILESEAGEVYEMLKGMAEKGNAYAARTWLQGKGKLVEKQEITHKIDGSIIAKAIVEAERKLRESGYRVADVQNESPLLRTEVLLSAGQGERKTS